MHSWCLVGGGEESGVEEIVTEETVVLTPFLFFSSSPVPPPRGKDPMRAVSFLTPENGHRSNRAGRMGKIQHKRYNQRRKKYISTKHIGKKVSTVTQRTIHTAGKR